jgi:hypothetical protein
MSWIKIEYTLLSKPEVMAMAAELGISEFEVTGHLVAFWCWVDANVSLECPRVIGTKSGLDRVCGRAGMVDNLIEVGWLRFDGKVFEVPNLDRHLSKGSKQRAVETRKKQMQRKRTPEETDGCPDSVPIESGQVLSSLILSNQQVSERSSETDSAEPKSAPANFIAEQYGFAFGQNVRVTNKRKVAIRERWKDPWWRENWMNALEKGSQSEFLMGRGESSWKISFDFFLKPDTVTKIMEGVYDGKSKRKQCAAEIREELNASGFDWIRASAAAAEADTAASSHQG